MNSEIITIGDELLIGQVLDTNSSWIAQQLNFIGVSVSRKLSVSDSLEEIKSNLRESIERAGIVIITGGLGPTKDDITKQALCEFFGTKLIFNEAVYLKVKSMFDRRNIRMPEINRAQAEIPENAVIIDNPRGTAPGMWFDHNRRIIVSLPGVPYEMKTMMEDTVLPELKKIFSKGHIFHKTILTHGIGESSLAEKIEDWENQLPKEIKLAYLPSPGFVRLRLSVSGEDQQFIESQVMKKVDSLRKIIPEFIWGEDNDSIESLIGRMLQKRNQSLCVAESCTGGAISTMIVRIPGSSLYFKGGVVAYSYESKTNLLFVQPATLEKFGAVSKETVLEMAEGAKKNFNTDYSIATSGIAGPDGGTPEKPVGTIWMAVASPNGITAKKFIFGKDREVNIMLAANSALHLLRMAMHPVSES